MKIVLHIGMYKTGTTAIQLFLARNRDRFLSQRILYPSRYSKKNGHHPLPWALGVTHPERDATIKAEEIARVTLKEARKAGAETIILSSEEFRNIDAKSLKTLKALFPGATFQIVAYLRRQDEFLISEYGQHVRMHSIQFSGTVSDFYFKHNLASRYNYWLLLDRWAKVFGDDSILVRVYDRSRFPNGNIIADFLQTIGIDATGFETERETDVNKNLSPIALEVLRRLNARRADEELHRKLMRLLDKVLGSDDKEYRLVSEKNRQDIMALFRQSNGLVARKWLHREDGKLFDEAEAPLNAASYEEPDKAVVTEALIDCLIDSVREPH